MNVATSKIFPKKGEEGKSFAALLANYLLFQIHGLLFEKNWFFFLLTFYTKSLVLEQIPSTFTTIFVPF